MTTPRSSVVDVVVAVRRYLSTIDTVRAQLGFLNVDDPANTWIFDTQLGYEVEGTGKSALVVSVAGGWQSSNKHNTAKFPRILLEVYSDSTRDSFKNVVTDDSRNKAWAVWQACNNVMHRVDGFAEVWGATIDDIAGTRVWGSELLNYPDVDSIPDWQGGSRLSAYYGLSIG